MFFCLNFKEQSVFNIISSKGLCTSSMRVLCVCVFVCVMCGVVLNSRTMILFKARLCFSSNFKLLNNNNNFYFYIS